MIIIKNISIIKGYFYKDIHIFKNELIQIYIST